MILKGISYNGIMGPTNSVGPIGTPGSPSLKNTGPLEPVYSNNYEIFIITTTQCYYQDFFISD